MASRRFALMVKGCLESKNLSQVKNYLEINFYLKSGGMQRPQNFQTKFLPYLLEFRFVSLCRKNQWSAKIGTDFN